MRGLREERGLTLKHVAAYIGVEFSTLARYERSEWPFRRDHVVALLDLYGIYDDSRRVQLIDLAQTSWRINQWESVGSRYAPTTGDSNGSMIVDPWWLQARAAELWVYAPLLIPEVVQNRDYAEALVRQTETDVRRADQIVRQVIARQQQLEDREPKTRLTILVEEPVLRRPIGGQAVMKQQLEYLSRLANQPHVDIRVLPTRAGWHPGLDGAFTVCKLDRPYPPVVLVEHLGGRLVVEATAADRYNAVFDKLKEAALVPVRSVELIHEAADDLTGSSRTRPDPTGQETTA
ncbi:helix-turn-helix domain-containing protein [Phytohabitans suffuscus]|nr:helix-turn-helix transcriptional regulator [Phytohabitans suffuscus]